MLFLVIIWLGCAAWAYVVGVKKDRGPQGALLGLFFGIFGVIAMYMIKGDKATNQLKSKVDQATLRVQLAKLEREEYDTAMTGTEPAVVGPKHSVAATSTNTLFGADKPQATRADQAAALRAQLAKLEQEEYDSMDAVGPVQD
jgi:hypothetical protein